MSARERRLTVFVSDVSLFGTVLSVSCWPGRSPKPQSKWPICGREAQAQCEVAKKLGCSMSDLGAKRRGPRKCQRPALKFRQGASLAARPGTDGGSESQLNSGGARSPQTSRSPTSPESRLLPIEQSDSAAAKQTRRRVADQESMQGSALTSVALRRTPGFKRKRTADDTVDEASSPVARRTASPIRTDTGTDREASSGKATKSSPKVLARLPPGLQQSSCLDAVHCAGWRRRTHCLCLCRRRHSHLTFISHLPSCLHRVLPSCPPTIHTRPKQHPRLCSRLCPLSVRWSSVLSFNRPVHTLCKWAQRPHSIGRLAHKTSWWGCVCPPLALRQKIPSTADRQLQVEAEGSRQAPRCRSKRLFQLSSTCLPQLELSKGISKRRSKHAVHASHRPGSCSDCSNCSNRDKVSTRSGNCRMAFCFPFLFCTAAVPDL